MFGSAGALLSDYRLPPVHRREGESRVLVTPVGALNGGAAVLSIERLGELLDGGVQSTVELVVMDPEGAASTTFGPFRGPRWALQEIGDQRPALTRIDDAVFAAGGETVLMALPGDSSVTLLDRRGTAVAAVRVPGAAVFGLPSDRATSTAYEGRGNGRWVVQAVMTAPGAVWLGVADVGADRAEWYRWSGKDGLVSLGTLRPYPVHVSDAFLATIERGEYDERVVAVYSIR